MLNQNITGIMRQGLNPKGRSRGGRGSNGKKGGPVRSGSADGAPGTRVRGNAHQLMDKYLALARDASAAGDRVLAENYFQHADHYYRVMSSSTSNANGRGARQSLPQPIPATSSLDLGETDMLEKVEETVKTEDKVGRDDGRATETVNP